jgi:GalNAc-alpha-(1->4)-GalNAc-alpha-(1->3)-diNAcBac-PP-undecaprenol alpha-1,4-N-acetyl-D-galactosaminyltransferase
MTEGKTGAMRVLCMIPAMAGPGGAERTMSYLVAHLAERHAVTLLTLERPGAPSFYPLPDSLRHIRINKLGGRGINRLFRVLSRPFHIRRAVRTSTPDVVVSFMDTMNVTALVSCLGLGIPVVVSERNDPALHRIGRIKEAVRDRLYPLARLVVVQTPRIARYFPAALQPKLRVIANPVPPAPLSARPDRPDAGGRLRIIAVSRLEPHKGFGRLIEAFARIAGQYLDWDLVIFGEGPERARLEALVARHDLDGRIRLAGVVTDVLGELAASHLMAFPSRYEGFPNALAEGLGAGLPAVGQKGVSGVEDLVVDGKTGVLIDASDDPASLAGALSALMADSRRRAELGRAARKHVAQWAPDKILGLWEAALFEAAGGRVPIRASEDRGRR